MSNTEHLLRCGALENVNGRGLWMPAEPNVTGMARLLYLVAGVGVSSWGLWGADQGWTQWAWLILGGALLVFGLIGYSPLHGLFLARHPKAG